MSQTPNWQPISQLPLIAHMIDGELEDTQNQYQTLQPAVARPYILDNQIVERLIKVFGERKEFQGIYAEESSKSSIYSNFHILEKLIVVLNANQVSQGHWLLHNIQLGFFSAYIND
jgi:hypothetical protein